MYLIDTHAHIYLPEFSGDLGSVISLSKDTGIQKILMPNIDSTTISPMLEVSARYPGYCLPMTGLHPCSVKSGFLDELDILERTVRENRFYGIGETGIDLYWDKTFYDQQVEALEFQARLAIRCKLPLILHCRDSMNETIAVIRKFAGENLSGIFHCFSGNSQQAREIIEMGFLLGIGGVVTFKNSRLAGVLSPNDIDHIVLETDSPYLAPVPFRGKRNDPSKLFYIAEKLAELMKITFQEAVEITGRNAMKLFGLQT